MPSSRACAAATPTPWSASVNRCRRFQRIPSGSWTGRFGKRCTTSSETRPPSRRPSTTRPLSAPRSIAVYACWVMPGPLVVLELELVDVVLGEHGRRAQQDLAVLAHLPAAEVAGLERLAPLAGDLPRRARSAGVAGEAAR